MSWIKLDTCLHTKPEVIQMAAALDCDECTIVGRLTKIWCWADQHSVNGDGLSVTETFLDRFINCKGFADAMRNVGWLIGDNNCITFPNFERHNGQTAKARALTKNRTEKYRTNSSRSCDVPSVTPASPDKIREDKIREERESEGALAHERPPLLSEIEAQASLLGLPKEEAQAFQDYYEARGWLTNAGQPIAKWQSLLSSWNKRFREQKCKDKFGNQKPEVKIDPEVIKMRQQQVADAWKADPADIAKFIRTGITNGQLARIKMLSDKQRDYLVSIVPDKTKKEIEEMIA